jgi:hypothetical protein
MDANIKRLAIEAGFIAWDEEEWHPAGVVFDWAGADDESLIKFYHLVRKEAILFPHPQQILRGGSAE